MMTNENIFFIEKSVTLINFTTYLLLYFYRLFLTFNGYHFDQYKSKRNYKMLEVICAICRLYIFYTFIVCHFAILQLVNSHGADEVKTCNLFVATLISPSMTQTKIFVQLTTIGLATK